METSEQLMEKNGGGKLISFQEGFRVSLFPMLGREEEKKMTGSSGQKCLESYERLRPIGLSLKMFLAFLLSKTEWYSNKCTLTWRLRDTKQHRRCRFQLVPLMRGTDETGFGLLLTPRKTTIMETQENFKKRMNKHGKRDRYKGMPNLTVQIIEQLIPTIGKNEGKGASSKRYRGSEDYRAAKTAEFMRVSKEDPIYLHPSFAEAMMGFPMGWTELPPTETP